jgi:hypothetical protein
MKDDLKTQKKTKNGRRRKNNGKQQTKKLKEIEEDLNKNKNEDDLRINKNLFLIPLKFRGKSVLGLAKLSKICSDKNYYIQVLYLQFH